MPQITSRPACRADLAMVRDMAHALAAHHGDAATLTVADLERDLFSDPPWMTVLVAQQGDALVGYAALCSLMQLQFGVRGLDMHHLFVVPTCRGMGVAKTLIEASITHAKSVKCSYVTVGTHPDNRAAQQVYLGAGFDVLPQPGPRFRMKW